MQIIGKTGPILVVMLSLAPVFGSAANEGYKCILANGLIEYRELPIQGVQCEPMKKLPKRSADANAEMDNLREQVAESAPAKELSKDELRAQNCERARSNAEILASDQDVIQNDANGGKSVLGAEQRAAALAQTEKDISYWCD